MKLAKILYFVKGCHPTEEDQIAALALKAKVAFRNAKAVSLDECVEDCDGVAGFVPKNYADAYPTAEEAIKKISDEFQKLCEKVKDVAPPKVAKPAQVAKPASTAAAPSWTPNVK